MILPNQKHSVVIDMMRKQSKRADTLTTCKHRGTVDLSSFLAGIGPPERTQFSLDPWQEEAIDKVQHNDVIVSVPTGSGKTFIAVEAARQAMDAEQTVLYTSPLKALSNTKFTEFSRIFGPDHVGILTGERRIHPYAEVLVMTTEILRNLLYDAASGEIDIRLDTLGLVILDEAQFLADPERGVVWEETIIFCPTQARLLLLSASIGNPEELMTWMSSIRPTTCHLIRHDNRSVPLRSGYLHPNGTLTPLFASLETPTTPQEAALHAKAQQLFRAYEQDILRPRHRGRR